MSPQQTIMLQVGYESLQAAGHTHQSVRDRNLGVFIGIGRHGGNLEEGAQLPPGAHAFIAAGASTAIVSNRLSFCLKVTGASLSLDTACSSALVALDSGYKYLRL